MHQSVQQYSTVFAVANTTSREKEVVIRTLPTDVNKGAHCTVGDHAFLSSLSLQSPGLGLEPLFHWAKFAARMLERFLLFRAETFCQPITLLNSYFCANNFTKWKTGLSCWVFTPYYFASTLILKYIPQHTFFVFQYFTRQSSLNSGDNEKHKPWRIT